MHTPLDRKESDRLAHRLALRMALLQILMFLLGCLYTTYAGACK